MQTVIKKSALKGTVSVPSSKSVLQRSMIAAFLSPDETELHAVNHCSDTISCLEAIQELGAKVIDTKNHILRIKGSGGRINSNSGTLSCGESGFAMRALSAVAAMADAEIVLTGTGSLMKRPVGFMTDVFNQLHVKCHSQNGLLPLTLHGPIQFKDITTDGSMSSQFLSGLLMIFPLAEKDHVIEVYSLKSRYYIDLTLEVMKHFGVSVTNENYNRFHIPGKQKYKGAKVQMEADWSAASCMLVAGATAGEVTVSNLSLKTRQPDKMILHVLSEAGAHVQIQENAVTVKKSGAMLAPFYFDATDCPDLFPALAALAAQCDGTSEITGVERLIHKESNRALALQEEFSKFRDGIISIEGNTMKIKGGKLRGAEVHSHHDHRIAMALAVAGLNAEGKTIITDSDAVSKSYPEFFNELSRIIAYE